MARYRRAADAQNATLVVVLAAEPGAPLDHTLVMSALAGQQSVTFSFSPLAPGGVISNHTVRMRQDHVPEVFDPALSAVGFLESRDMSPGRRTLIPLPNVARPLEAFGGSMIAWDHSLLA